MDQQALLAVIAFVLIYLAAFVLGTGVLALDAPFHGRAHTSALDLIFASASTLAGRNRGDGVLPSCGDSRSGISQAGGISFFLLRADARALAPCGHRRPVWSPTVARRGSGGPDAGALGSFRCGTLARLGQ